MDSCNNSELFFDEACVFLKSLLKFDTWLYSLSSDCFQCPYKRLEKIPLESNFSIKFNTVQSYSWRVLKNNGTEDFLSATDSRNVLCQLDSKLGQFGQYELIINDTNCRIETIKHPTNAYISLAIAIGIVMSLLLGLSLVNYLTKALLKIYHKSEMTNKPEKSIKNRVKAIDTFRGISIIYMIFVNNGAGGFPLLEHATWDGLRIGDFVFPCFLWIMGVCIPISLFSQLSRGVSRLKICVSIVKRSIWLFLIGISLNTLVNGSQLEDIRIFGVLQRFSVAYLISGCIYALQSSRTKEEKDIFKNFADIISLWIQWIIIICIVIIHSLITFKLSIPECPRGYLGPGGQHANGKYINCTGGSAGYIDKTLMGVNHVFQWPEIRSVYGSEPFDPEGILGCLTSIFQVFLGIQSGQTILYYRDWKQRILRWFSWALILGIVGCILHLNDIIPINKHLWSLSFVFVTTSFALCLLCICYLLVDVVKIWRGGPFRIPGMNALVMYIGHMVCYKIFPFHWKFGKMKTHELLLAESFWCVGLWIVIAYVLYKRKIFITL
ncbi:heparan-alpha-glucosaminide N-acetyltransferase-like isoform X2 [Leptopilina boulardi]|uniref:heparan-alpha-glucosaminide N-acetyltransferase-like isoform X2 n=1 Tax=Leptopilina boulardi TaxID=63433 RepID=UPI0021F67B18|nr:heparan-alpha-glucosaminide N-acetyltransferase-like isoform X2 [Leptopilina boulardi]